MYIYILFFLVTPVFPLFVSLPPEIENFTIEDNVCCGFVIYSFFIMLRYVPSIPAFIDAEKAFDKIQHPFMIKVSLNSK